MKHRKTFSASFIAALLSAGVSAAEPPGLQEKDLTEMRQGVRELVKEMEKDAAATREVTRQLLKEAQKNKKVLKEMMHEVARNKEAVQGMVESVLQDAELQKELKGMRTMLQELASELGSVSGSGGKAQ